MAHRTQITLTDDLYERLLRESSRTGLSLAELVRRALDRTLGVSRGGDAEKALDASFGAWGDRPFDGASYVEGLRRGMRRRLAG